MRNATVPLIAWAARLVGWGSLLSLAGYIAWNRDGISVRGQIGRLALGAEKEDALRSILARPDVKSTLNHLQGLTHDIRWASPVRTVIARKPIVLRLTGSSASGTRKKVYFCFDSDGRLAGNPVELPLPRAGTVFGIPYEAAILQVHSRHFLVITGYQQLSTGPNAFTLVPSRFTVFQLSFPDSNCVFALSFTPVANQFAAIEAAPDSSGEAGLHLIAHTRGTPAFPKPATQILASFAWDELQGRFIGPERDPNGAWEVISPTADSNGLDG